MDTLNKKNSSKLIVSIIYNLFLDLKILIQQKNNARHNKDRWDFTNCLLLRIRLAKYNFPAIQQILESLQLNFIYKNTLI